MHCIQQHSKQVVCVFVCVMTLAQKVIGEK